MGKKKKIPKKYPIFILVVYLVWGVIWFFFLQYLDSRIGLNNTVFMNIPLVGIIVILCLIKDIGDFAFKKKGGPISTSPLFEHLPLILLLIFVFGIENQLILLLALIDAIIDFIQDLVHWRRRETKLERLMK